MGPQDNVIIMTHEPIWLIEWWVRKNTHVLGMSVSQTPCLRAKRLRRFQSTLLVYMVQECRFWQHPSAGNLRQLIRGHLRGRARVHLVGGWMGADGRCASPSLGELQP